MSIEGLPEKQLANTRTQRDINAIIEYLRTLADSAGGSAHIIAKESLQYAQRAILDFSGEGVQVLDYPGSDTTRVLIGGSSGSAGDAGADIRIIGSTIQRAGNGTLLYDAGGDPVREYAFTEAGVTEAFADSAVGDVVGLPAGTLVGDVTVPAGRTLRGMGEATVIDGEVTLKGHAGGFRLTRVANSAAVLAGIVAGEAGDLGVIDDDVIVDVQNSGGPAYAVYMVTGGGITVREGDLLAEVGTDGYAAYVTSGPFRHERGRAVGTTALTPYWM